MIQNKCSIYHGGSQMLDKILDFASAFDWISPALAAIQDIKNGPNHTFFIPDDCGWSSKGIARLLKRNGVKTWGHMIVNHEIMITLSQQQAQWAQYLLEREGIPIQHGLIRRANMQAGHPARKEKQKDLLETVDGWLEKVDNLLNL
jgi:hypothetical protein